MLCGYSAKPDLTQAHGMNSLAAILPLMPTTALSPSVSTAVSFDAVLSDASALSAVSEQAETGSRRTGIADDIVLTPAPSERIVSAATVEMPRPVQKTSPEILLPDGELDQPSEGLDLGLRDCQIQPQDGFYVPTISNLDVTPSTPLRPAIIASAEKPQNDPIVQTNKARSVPTAQPVTIHSLASATPPKPTAIKLPIDTVIAATPASAERLVAPNDNASQAIPAMQLPPAYPVQPAIMTTEPSKAAPTLDLAQDALWLDTLARDITASANSVGRLSFRLVPEFLGKLDVALTHDQGSVDIAMQADTDTARRIIIGEQPRLIEELRQSGLKVGNFEMTTGQQNSSPRQHPSPSQPSPPQQIAAQFKSPPSLKRNGRFA
jgi:flagellar hook-length control protein FliK